MEITQSKALDAGRRAKEFLDANAARVAAFVSAMVRKQLDAGVAAIEGFMSQQNSAGNTAHGETVAQATLRATIYEQFLKRITVIAQQALPGVSDLGVLVVSFHDARDGRRNDFETKVGDAIAAAAKYQQVFSDHGMPDIVQQLGDALAQFKASIAAQGRNRGNRIGATWGLDAMDRSLRKTLHLLDSLLTPALARDADLLANWQASRKIHKAAVTPNPTGAAPEVAPTAARLASGEEGLGERHTLNIRVPHTQHLHIAGNSSEVRPNDVAFLPSIANFWPTSSGYGRW